MPVPVHNDVAVNSLDCSYSITHYHYHYHHNHVLVNHVQHNGRGTLYADAKLGGAPSRRAVASTTIPPWIALALLLLLPSCTYASCNILTLAGIMAFPKQPLFGGDE